jgi:iron complex outermembrane receptor protein
LQDSPKYSANISYSHQFRFGGGSTLTPRLSAFYKGAYWMQGNGTSLDPWGASTALNKDSPLRQNAYSLYNAYLTWQSADGKFTVGGYVRNIGNKAAMTNIGNDGGTGVAYVSLSAPRTFGITINATL